MFFLLMCVLNFGILTAQEKIYNNNEVDVVAEPYEGIKEFYKAVLKEINVVNPEKVSVEKVDFRIFFVVEKDGTFANFNVEGISLGYAENVIATLKKMPKWKPAVYNNENVRSQMVFPVKVKR